jgi:hypothetical protein
MKTSISQLAPNDFDLVAAFPLSRFPAFPLSRFPACRLKASGK